MDTRRLDTTHQRAAMQRMHALLLTLLLLVPLGPAAATVYCVGSVSELQTATDNIENHGAVHDHDLRIRSGWYLLTPVAQQTHAVTIDYKFSQYTNIRISGGWNAGCTQQAQSVTAATISVLDGQGLTGTLAVNRESWGIAGDPNVPAGKLQIDQLRIINSANTGLLMAEINPGSYNHAVDVTLDRLQVDMSEDGAGINIWSKGAFVLRNSALIGNRGYRAALNVTSEQAIHVYNNTLRYNQITDGSGGNAQVGLNTLGVIYFYNNLIADGDYVNLTTDLYIVDGNAFVRNNRFVGNVVQATPDLLIQSGNTTALPQFISSLNWRLASNSPLRDLGYTPGADPGLGSRDYDGQARVVGAAVDVGAFEYVPDVLFVDGFETGP